MSLTILLLENEPLILMDLEYAGVDSGCRVLTATTCDEALAHLGGEDQVDVAVLDVTLDDDCTCLPVAQELTKRSIPFLLHSGDLDRVEERVRTLGGPLIAKPASAEDVISAAIGMVDAGRDQDVRSRRA